MFPHEVIDLQEIAERLEEPDQERVRVPVKRNQVLNHVPELEIETIEQPYED